MTTLYYFSVFLHILAAMTWIGGMIFIATVVVPVIRRPQLQSFATRLVDWTGRRFRAVGWISLNTLIITGTYNLIYRFGWDGFWQGEPWQGEFGQTLMYKLFFVAVVLALSAYHDFRVVPKATAGADCNLSTDEVERFRKQASLLGRLNLLFNLVILFFALSLVRGLPW